MIHHNFILCLVLSLTGTYAFDIRRSRQISRTASNKSTLNDTNPYSITPYPQSGYRPGRAFDLPSETTTEYTIETTTVQEGPYPPSGWKPKGKSFPLPNEEIDEQPSNKKPSEFYGTPTTPNPTYLPPNKEYLPSNKNNTDIDENEIEGTKENTDKTANEIPNVLPEYGFYYIQLPNGVLQKVYYRSDRTFNGDPTETEIDLKTTTTETTVESTTNEEGSKNNTLTASIKPKSKSLPLPNDRIDEVSPENKPSEFYGIPTASNSTYSPENKNNTGIDENNIETLENTEKAATEIPIVLPEYGFYYIQLPNGVLQKVYYRSDRTFNGEPTETEIDIKTTTIETTVENTTNQEGSKNNTLTASIKPKSKSLPLPNDRINEVSPENKPSEFYGIPTASNSTYSPENKNNTGIDENNIETLENTENAVTEIPIVLPEYGFYYVQLSNGELQKVYYRTDRAFDGDSTNEVVSEPTTTETPLETKNVEDGPYLPSGWKPKGKSFPLPNEEIDNEPSNNKPNEFYGPPTTRTPIYLPPSNTYLPGIINNTEVDANDFETIEENTDQPAIDIPVVLPEYEFYYVQLPNGLLQKVYYRSERTFYGNPISTLQYQPIYQQKPVKYLAEQPRSMKLIAQSANIEYVTQNRQFWGKF